MAAYMCIVSLAVTYFCLFLGVFAEWNTNDYLRREHTLVKPYQGSGASMPLWDFVGSTLVTNNHVRLTPDHQSRQGAIWNTQPCHTKNWELHVQFAVHGSGTTLFGDGMAIWYAREKNKLGNVFGNADFFSGLAIFMDTYSNHNGPHNHEHPYISAMVNNGSMSYDHDRDGTHTQLAGCEAKFRNKDYSTYMAIRYHNEVLKPHQSHFAEAWPGGSGGSDCCSRLDNPVLVSETVTNVDFTTSVHTGIENTPRNAFPDRSSCALAEAKPDDMPYIRKDLQAQGISQEATNIILDSWRASTKEQYRVYLEKWSVFCGSRETTPLYPSVALVLDFLTSLYQDGLSYSALNTARSALSAVLFLPGNVVIGTHPLICRFMKGVFQRKPVVPRYSTTWDVNIVLKYLKSLFPVETLTLKQVTYKLVTLIALVTGQRCQTLSMLTLDNMRKTPTEVVFTIMGNLKQTRPGYTNPLVVLPTFKGNRKLCVVKTLERYLDLTQSLRKDQALFITHCKPHGVASKATISRWVKETLRKAGIDTTVFTAHSTRTASSSAAMKNNVPLDVILKTAGWSSDCTFQKFYNKPIVSHTNNAFARAILSGR